MGTLADSTSKTPLDEQPVVLNDVQYESVFAGGMSELGSLSEADKFGWAFGVAIVAITVYVLSWGSPFRITHPL